MSKTITIIDTFGFLFRSFFALPPLRNKDGFPTGLLTGFTNFIASVEKEHNTDYIVFALDMKGPTFRNEIDPEYKANRQPPPEDLLAQLPIAIEWVEKMGFATVSKSGYEADDMIASVAKVAVKAGMKVRIVSHDKDLYQMIDDGKVVVVDAIKRKNMDEEACIEKYGIRPDQFTDYQSLLGDSADNVPGVKGVGKVTAQKLLSQFETLQGIYDNIDEVKPAGVQKKLRDFEKDAWRSQKLVTLVDDIFESLDFSKFILSDKNPFLGIVDDLHRYELNGILRQLKAKGMIEDLKPPKALIDEVPREALESVLLDSETKLFEVINAIEKDSIIALDTETTGLNHKKDSLVGFSFAVDDTKGYYVPLAHAYLGVGEQISKEIGVRALRQLLDFKIVGHNLKFDLKFICPYLGINAYTPYADSMLLAWLVNSEKPVGLDKQADLYFQHKMISFKDTVKKGENFSSVALDDAAAYAGEDALITYKLYFKLLEQLKLQNAEHLIQEAKEVEFPFIQTLISMEEEGIKVDTDFLQNFKTETEVLLDELRKKIYGLAGGEFNINSTKQLGVILFETLELPVGKKTKTGYSTDEKVLNGLFGTHDIIPALLNYREVFKLYSTYITPLLELGLETDDRRIHTSFLQTGTATGRLSSKNPNLQNIPVRSPMGAKIREAFVAQDGKTLIGIDYSQIELRLLAHFSQDPTLLDAFAHDKDIHRQTAVAIFGEEEADAKRNVAKTVNFGLLYGMGPKKLSIDIGVTTKEAKLIIEAYFENFPTVKTFLRSIADSAKEIGYVETLLRRRRYFNFESAPPMMKAAYERESVNTVFQGSAADLIKLSMNKIHEHIKTKHLKAKMLLQIHDELIFEVDENEAESLAEEFKNIMENIYKIAVPLRSSVNIGKNWSQLK
ncbi:DNA polymerase I [Sulfurimonas sp. MAG313]|nr:DNA polymerase I [Sulfurimonas sp. MAG313]MDF1879999.1 DNA polymerase I [Sulfurimonas sp. MAG313]